MATTKGTKGTKILGNDGTAACGRIVETTKAMNNKRPAKQPTDKTPNTAAAEESPAPGTLSDEEIAAAAALDDRLRAGTVDSDDHSVSPTLAAEVADTVRMLRDVLGRHQNDEIVKCETTLTASDEFRLRAIDSAAQTLPLDGSHTNRERQGASRRLFSVYSKQSPAASALPLTKSTPPPVVEHLPQRFTVQEELGRGNYGIVYRALDKHLKREVAIKVLRPELMTDDNLRTRFLQESQAAARLNHPCIVRVFEAQEST